MANPYRGEAAITIGGKERTLKFDHNALADLEDLLGGRSVLKIIRNGEVGSSFLRTAIAVGLRHESLVKPTLVGKWLSESPERYSQHASAVLKAITLAIKGPGFERAADQLDVDEEDDEQEAPAPQEVDDDDGPPQAAGAGVGAPASANQPA